MLELPKGTGFLNHPLFAQSRSLYREDITVAEIAGMLGVLFVLGALLYGLLWVVNDAERAGKDKFRVALLALVFWPFSILVWWLIRPKQTSEEIEELRDE